jgi:hypothetical protein
METGGADGVVGGIACENSQYRCITLNIHDLYHSYQLFASHSSVQRSSCAAIDEGAMHRPSREVHLNFLAAEDYVIIHLPPSRNFTFFCVLITMALILIINCSVYAIASWSFIRCPDGSSSLFR